LTNRLAVIAVNCLLLSTLTISIVSFSAEAADEFHHHQFKAGEEYQYQFEDTDTVFPATQLDGVVQPGDGYRVQEVHIPVSIEVHQVNNELERQLHFSRQPEFREGIPPSTLAATPFTPVRNFSKLIPQDLQYSYKNDSAALLTLDSVFAHLYGIQLASNVPFFKQIQDDKGGSFLFFKMQDIHQMQASVEQIREGISPGQTAFTQRHDVPGLGVPFKAAPSQLIFEKVEYLDGTRCGYFKVISLGNEVIQSDTERTFTNFFYTLHVALEGPHQGQLLLGEAQETANIYAKGGDGSFGLQAVLQRQFSIRLMGK
jgi:hypothetical protein